MILPQHDLSVKPCNSLRTATNLANAPVQATSDSLIDPNGNHDPLDIDALFNEATGRAPRQTNGNGHQLLIDGAVQPEQADPPTSATILAELIEQVQGRDRTNSIEFKQWLIGLVPQMALLTPSDLASFFLHLQSLKVPKAFCKETLIPLTMKEQGSRATYGNGDSPTPKGDHSPKVTKLADLSKFVNGKLSGQRVGRSTKLAVSKAITDHLLSKGQLVFDTVRDTPAVLDEDYRLFAIGDDKQALAARAYLRESGINATETAYKFLLEEMRVVALKNQCRIEQKPVYRNNALYIPCGASFVVKATIEKGLEKLPNGIDGVYFWADVSIPEWTPVATTKAIDPMTLDAFKISYDAPAQSKEYTPEMQKKLVCVWIMALLAGVEPLPILATLGGAGGGKSTLLKAIAKLLYGQDADLTTLSSDKRDFDAAMSKRILVGYDNLDKIPDKGEWVFDALAAVATGATNQRRTFFTNADLTDLAYIAGCMISSRTAVFARQDVAERTLPIFTRRFEDSKRTEEAVLYADLADKRDGVLSYLAYGAVRLMYTKEQAPKGLAARFQTFAKLTWAYCNAYRKPEQAEGILAELFKVQSVSVGDADPLMQAIVEHLPQDGFQDLTASEVVARIQALTDTKIPNLGGGKRIANNLRELKPMLAMLGIDLSEREAMGRPHFTMIRRQIQK